MDKKSFVFYVSWNDAIKKMDNEQLRRFIDNLCNYAEGQEVILNGIVDEILWSQVKPLLDHNENKRQRRIEGGKKGGLAKASNDKQAVAGYSIPSVEGRGMKEEGRGMKEEGRGMKEEGRRMMDEGKKDEVEKVNGNITIPDKLIKIKQTIDKGGWGHLSPEDCNYWWENKHLVQ